MSSAEKNNEKLFPLFRRNLTESNVNLYAATADKLALWASRDKAYYPFARPVIVELLETAYAQVRRHSGTPDKPFHISDYSESLKPWAEPFIKLLETVAPFYNLFSEPDLQFRLRALLQTIGRDPLAPGTAKQPVLEVPPTSMNSPTNGPAQSASSVARPSPSVHLGPSPFAHSRARSGTPAATPSLQLPMQIDLPANAALSPSTPFQHGVTSPPVTIHASLASIPRERRHSPVPYSPSTPGTSASAVHISGHMYESAPPRIDPSQSAVAGPSSVPSASPTLSTASSPAISTATAADPFKRKAKKRKKRLTEDDFIMADLADWESARAGKATVPASPLLADVERPVSRAGSAGSAQAGSQTPRETQATFSRARSSSNAPAANGPNGLSVLAVSGRDPGSTEQSSSVLYEPDPVPSNTVLGGHSDKVASGEPEGKSGTPTPVVTSGLDTAQAVSSANVSAPTPTLSAATAPEAGPHARNTSPSSPRTAKKKRPSQEFHFVSENGRSPTSLHVKRNKHSPSLVVFRVDTQAQVNGVQSSVHPTIDSIPESVDVEQDVEQKRKGSLSAQIPADMGVHGMSETKDDIQADTSTVAQGETAHHESRPLSELAPGAEDLTTRTYVSTAAPASDESSQDVEMVDQLQDSDIERAEPVPESKEVNGGGDVESFVAKPTDGPRTDVEVEPLAGQSGPDAAAFVQRRPSLVDGSQARVRVATPEAPASAGLDHTQSAGVKACKGDIGMEVDAQPVTDTLPSTMASNPNPLEAQPPAATFEGVMQELAEKKGMPDAIMSRIVYTLSENAQTVSMPASAELHDDMHVPSSSEVDDTPSKSIVPQKRSRSRSLATENGDEESNQQRRSKSPPRTPNTEFVSTSTSSSIPAVEPSLTEKQFTTPTGDHTIPAEDAAPASLPTARHHDLEVEVHGEATALMEVDMTGGPAPAEEASVAIKLEQTTYIPSDHPEAQEPGGPCEEDAVSNAEPPITLATIPQATQDLVEEGEIETSVATTPSTAVDSTILPDVDLNGPLAYSELRVLDCRRGSSAEELIFEFNIDEELMSSLSRWVRRYKSTEDVSQTYCVSFSCYPFNDCVDYIRAKSQDSDQVSSYEKLCRSVVMKWPKDGRLWAELVNSNGVHKVSMSPPYLRDAEQVLDITEHVTPGRNALHVYQLRDHSNFVFTLNVHTPVPSQLRELQARREHDASWKAFLHSLSTIEFPEFPWNQKFTIQT